MHKAFPLRTLQNAGNGPKNGLHSKNQTFLHCEVFRCAKIDRISVSDNFENQSA